MAYPRRGAALNRRHRNQARIHNSTEERVATGGSAVQVAAAMGPDAVWLSRPGIELVRALLEQEAALNGVPIREGVPGVVYNSLLLATAHRDRSGHADVRKSPTRAPSGPWISTSAAADQAGVTARTVLRWAAAGYLGQTTRRKGARLVSQTALAVYLAARSHPTDSEETPA